MKKLISFLCLALFPIVVFAQDAQLRILSNHPDLSVKVKRCVSSGKNLIIDLTATNLGYDDVNGFKIAPAITTAYDDEGNVYKGKDGVLGVKVANQTNYTFQRNAFADQTPSTKLIPNVPVKITITIPNCSTAASSIALFELGVVCVAWNMPFDWNSNMQRVAIRNIPIERR